MSAPIPTNPHTPHEPPPPTAGPRTNKRWLIPGAIGVVAGLVVGVLVGTFLRGNGVGDVGDSPDADADVACQYVQSVSDDIDPDVALDLDQPPIWRLQAIGLVAMAAATGDSRYETLGDQGRDLTASIQRFDTEMLVSSLDAMAETCRSF